MAAPAPDPPSDQPEQADPAAQTRNKTIIQNLNSHGVVITYDELERVAAGGTIGRPHIAQLLVEQGRALDMRDAFATWLRPGARLRAQGKARPARSHRAAQSRRGH